MMRALLAVLCLLLTIVPASAKLTAQQQCAAERDFVQLNADLAAKQSVPNVRGRESYICLPDTVDPRGPEVIKSGGGRRSAR